MRSINFKEIKETGRCGKFHPSETESPHPSEEVGRATPAFLETGTPSDAPGFLKREGKATENSRKKARTVHKGKKRRNPKDISRKSYTKIKKRKRMGRGY